MNVTQEVAALCSQASRELDPKKKMELAEKINELLERQNIENQPKEQMKAA